jgi:hypothetical protein
MYPGTMGSTQGEMKEMMPARKAVTKLTFSTGLLLFSSHFADGVTILAQKSGR